MVLAYADEYRGAEVLATLRRLHQGADLALADAACFVRATDWTVTLHHSVDLSEQPWRSAGFWRDVVVSLVPAPGTFDCRVSVGKLGLTEDFKRELAAELPPGSSAVLLLVPPLLVERYVAELYRFGGKLLHTPISLCSRHEK